MTTPHTARPISPFSPQLIASVYVPSAIVLLGVGIAKREWLPFATVIPLVLAALHYFGNVKGTAVAPKALRPDTFQEFKLKEKTVCSPNVAM